MSYLAKQLNQSKVRIIIESEAIDNDFDNMRLVCIIEKLINNEWNHISSFYVYDLDDLKNELIDRYY